MKRMCKGVIAVFILATVVSADLKIKDIFKNVNSLWSLDFVGTTLLNMQGEVSN